MIEAAKLPGPADFFRRDFASDINDQQCRSRGNKGIGLYCKTRHDQRGASTTHGGHPTHQGWPFAIEAVRSPSLTTSDSPESPTTVCLARA